MDITRESQADGWVELRVRGRLDNYWADHFKSAIEELVRGGTSKVRLDLGELIYLSSAGVGVLVWCHKHLDSIRGKFVVSQVSDAVREVLQVTRLDMLLAGPLPSARQQMTTVALGRPAQRDNVSFEVFGPAGGGVVCRKIGMPDRLKNGGYGPGDCRTVRFPAESLAVGLGALGDSFADCQARFGEFLVAAGAAAYLPTDGTAVPDYLIAAADTLPDLQVCYGLLCEGKLPRFARFEADSDVGRVPLSRLVRGLLHLAGADRIGFVLVGETTGLLGAALRRSPAVGAANGSPFTFPGVRDWLTFTSERAYMRAMTLVAGVALSGDPGPLASWVRPLGESAELQGHCHAAAFSYRPLPRGELDMRSTVAGLFEHQRLQGILHLLADYRQGAGLGESEFVRGGCWFGPITDVAENGS